MFSGSINDTTPYSKFLSFSVIPYKNVVQRYGFWGRLTNYPLLMQSCMVFVGLPRKNLGAPIFSIVFHIALKRERYEDCAKMKEAASKYGINLHAAEEDWISSFWRMGLSGKCAQSNKLFYLSDAFRMVGYDEESVNAWLEAIE